MMIAAGLFIARVSGAALDAHGKTDAQILAMGASGWSDWHSRQLGFTTVELADSASEYGEALSRRNDRALRTLPAADRRRLEKVRTRMLEYGYSAMDVG